METKSAMVAGKDSGGKLTFAGLLSSLLLYGAAAVFVTGPEDTRLWLGLYLAQWIAFASLLRGRTPAPALVLSAALVFRILLVSTPLWLSDDLYRYLLDGRVLAAGIHPFRYAPQHEIVRGLEPVLTTLVNHPELPTIYPPLAQLLGWAAALLRLEPTGWRVAISVLDLGTVAAVARLFGGGATGWRAAAVYGLCPLAIWESGGNGHLEGVTALLFVLALLAWGSRRFGRGGAALGAAGLVKLFPILLLPVFVRGRGGVRFAVVATVVFGMGWLPFFLGEVDPTSSLRHYLAHWSFNSPLFELLSRLIPSSTVLRGIPFAFLLGAGIVVARRRLDPVRAIPHLLFGFLVLGPTLHPWYALWVLPWLGPRPHLGLLAFVAAMGLSYEVWWEVHTGGLWRLDPAWNAGTWLLVGLGWIAQWRLDSREKRRLAATGV